MKSTISLNTYMEDIDTMKRLCGQYSKDDFEHIIDRYAKMRYEPEERWLLIEFAEGHQKKVKNNREHDSLTIIIEILIESLKRKPRLT